jgi:ferredoxin
MPRYQVTIDRDACDGIFACLVRDSRFVEDDDGLAGIESDSGAAIDRTDDAVVATFDDDELDTARQAAAACPPNAITVEEVE